MLGWSVGMSEEDCLKSVSPALQSRVSHFLDSSWCCSLFWLKGQTWGDGLGGKVFYLANMRSFIHSLELMIKKLGTGTGGWLSLKSSCHASLRTEAQVPSIHATMWQHRACRPNTVRDRDRQGSGAHWPV